MSIAEICCFWVYGCLGCVFVSFVCVRIGDYFQIINHSRLHLRTIFTQFTSSLYKNVCSICPQIRVEKIN